MPDTTHSLSTGCYNYLYRMKALDAIRASGKGYLTVQSGSPKLTWERKGGAHFVYIRTVLSARPWLLGIA